MFIKKGFSPLLTNKFKKFKFKNGKVRCLLKIYIFLISKRIKPRCTNLKNGDVYKKGIWAKNDFSH